MAETFLTDWNDPTYEERNEIVFANRNKNYGAYFIRQLYNKTVNKSFLIATTTFVVLVSLPVIINMFNSAKEAAVTQEVEVVLSAPPPVDPAEPPPPPPPPPPPVVETVKFTPPVVVDKPVEDEEPPPQEKLVETNVSTVTQEGDPNAEVAPPDIVEDPDAGKIFTIVEEMPQFPGGGEAALLAYMRKNVVYPPMARENGIEGVVYVTFVVDKDGKIKDVKILRGRSGGLDEEALRVIRSMPDWKPGKQNGRSVAVQFNLPVNFKLQ